MHQHIPPDSMPLNPCVHVPESAAPSSGSVLLPRRPLRGPHMQPRARSRVRQNLLPLLPRAQRLSCLQAGQILLLPGRRCPQAEVLTTLRGLGGSWEQWPFTLLSLIKSHGLVWSGGHGGRFMLLRFILTTYLCVF